jgi:hypothetical protein
VRERETESERTEVQRTLEKSLRSEIIGQG